MTHHKGENESSGNGQKSQNCQKKNLEGVRA